MQRTVSQLIQQFEQQGLSSLLLCGKRGIEKEGLRYRLDHQLSSAGHPASLGKTLTHTEITTDYAESLLELVVPAYEKSQQTLAHLCFLHRAIAHFCEGEYMLNASMPAAIADTESATIADYGRSNSGQLKELYRKGLAVRYGKAMQLIAGIHFNYSLDERIFVALAEMEQQPFSRAFVDEKYMNLVRNIRENAWLTSYLFGHSPALDRSFFGQRAHQLQSFDRETLYLPYATSLRLSDIGYHNKTGHLVGASSLQTYVQDLQRAVLTPSPAFSALGLSDATGQMQQMNTHLLQIENEYYTEVRPKQIVRRGESTLHALAERGIAYVELRTLDINCFERCGLNQEQLDFLELFMLYNLLTPNHNLCLEDEDRAKHNLSQVAAYGRKPNLKLQSSAGDIALKALGQQMLEEMQAIAETLDAISSQCECHTEPTALAINLQGNLPCNSAGYNPVNRYQRALKSMQVRIDDPEATPSARVLQTLAAQQQTYHEFITEQSLQHRNRSLAQGLSEAEQVYLQQLKADSEKREQQLCEASQQQNFADYLAAFQASYTTL